MTEQQHIHACTHNAPQGTSSSKKKKQAKLKRVMQTVKKGARREAGEDGGPNGYENFAALHLLNDPQVCARVHACVRASVCMHACTCASVYARVPVCILKVPAARPSSPSPICGLEGRHIRHMHTHATLHACMHACMHTHAHPRPP